MRITKDDVWVVLVALVFVALLGFGIFVSVWYPQSDEISYSKCTSSHSDVQMKCDSIVTGGGINIGGGLECRPTPVRVCDVHTTFVCEQFATEKNFIGRPYQRCTLYKGR
jgi:hypothetical protein